MINFEKLCTSVDNMADFLAEVITCYGCPMVGSCKNDGKECREVMKEWLEMEGVDNE